MMIERQSFSKWKLYGIIGFSALLVGILSLEVLFQVKDYGEFMKWYVNSTEEFQRINESQAFEVYITAHMSRYVSNLIVPMIFTLHSFHVYKKSRINGLFVFLWAVLLAGAFAFTVVEWNYFSVFYYLRLFSQLGLLLLCFSLGFESASRNQLD